MTAARIPESDRVAQRAYSIWEEEGRPDGRDRAHWDRAERELEAPDDAGPVPLDGTVAPEAATPAAEDVATEMAPAKKPARARKTPAKPPAAPDSAEPAAAAPKRSRTKSAS